MNGQPQDNDFEKLEALLLETTLDNNSPPAADPSTEDEFDDLDGLLTERSGYQRLAGKPSTAVAGKKYMCPVAGCTTAPWFRMGLRTPPLCEEHGVLLVPAEQEG